MPIIGFLRGQAVAIARMLRVRRARRSACPAILRSDWASSLSDPTRFYERCFDFFHSRLPAQFREHRAYFHNEASNRRGFGEDAFHVMWFLLLEVFQPANFLEIGIFRGQVVTLVALWAKQRGRACEVHGISPFSSAGDSVSAYRADIDYYEDTLANFEHFELEHPHLLRAFSTDPAALNLISSRSWDIIYIDGNHDYEVVLRDWAACSQAVKPGGLIVLDDAGLTTKFKPPVFATKGHPGPSRLATEIDPAWFREVLQVGHNRVFQKLPVGGKVS